MSNRKFLGLILVAVMVGWIGLITATADGAEKVNINTASAEELTQLKGIGPGHAARIVEYREKNGPFETPEDLIKVPGVGQKTFENNKDFILVKEPEQG